MFGLQKCNKFSIHLTSESSSTKTKGPKDIIYRCDTSAIVSTENQILTRSRKSAKSLQAMTQDVSKTILSKALNLAMKK